MRLSAHVGPWLQVGRRGRKVRQWQVAAGLISGQLKKSSRRRKLVRVMPVMRLGTPGRSQSRLPGMRPLWTTQHGFHGASQSEGASWSGSSRKADLGYFPTGSTPLGPSRVVASLLSCCASSPIAAGSAGFAARARGQAGGATLSAANGGSGSRQNPSTLDGARGALIDGRDDEQVSRPQATREQDCRKSQRLG